MRQLAVSTALVLATLAGLAILWELRGAVLIFFLSLGTSAALRPVIERLHQLGLPKSLALALTYLSCVVGFLGLLLALVFPLTAEVQQLAHDFKTAYQDVAQTWPQGNALEQAVATRLPPWDDLQRAAWRAGSAAVTSVTETPVDSSAQPSDPSIAAPPATSWWAPRAVHTFLGATWGLFGTMLNVLIIVVLSLYWSIDRVHFERLWLSLLDVKRRQRARDTWRAIEQATGAYLQREVVQSLIAGLMLGLGFWMFGQPYPVLSAAIGALVWLIPFVGAPLAMLSVAAIWLPRFVIAGGQGLLVTLLAATVYTLLLLLLLEWLIEPRLFHRKRYNPILLVLIAVGMVDWLGLLGLLIAPPVAAAVQILGNQYLASRNAAAQVSEPSTNDLVLRMSTLRARLADSPEVPDETRAMVDRLGQLVEQSRAVLGMAEAGGTDAPATLGNSRANS